MEYSREQHQALRNIYITSVYERFGLNNTGDKRIKNAVDVLVFIKGIPFDIPSLEGLHITHLRLYRTVSGSKTADFRLVCELPADTDTYTDTAHDKDISTEILSTSQWDPIPDNAQGLIKTDNGLYACFRGNELLVSEPFIAYAYPAAYRVTVEDFIVALAHVDGTIVVLTSGRPYLAQGGVPESLQIVHLPIEQACVSARSVGSLAGGVVYASPDGLMLFTTSEQTLLTGALFTREQWQALHPETLMGTVLDGQYIGFFAGTGSGIMLDMNRRDVVWVELSHDWKVHALYHHSADDCLYLSAETPDGNGVYQFEAGQPLAYRWRSKPFFTSALTCMTAVRAEGEHHVGAPVSVRVFGPDIKTPRAQVRLTDNRTKRIPPTRAEKLWSVEVAGTSPVYELRLGGSVEDVEYGR